MVESAQTLRRGEILSVTSPIEIPEEKLNWCTVSLGEVLQRDNRLEASVFGIEGKHAREILKQCKWSAVTIAGDIDGLCKAYRPPIYKRIWAENGYPYFLPSQVTSLKPRPERYLSKVSNLNIELNRAKIGEILLTCSGTIGNVSLVSKTLNGLLFSQNIIHLTFNTHSNAGYVYAFIKTKIGQILLKSNEYGAVISHIDPNHLESIPIPNPPEMLKRRIHDLIVRSYALRDESNDILDKAEVLLREALKLPPLERLEPIYFEKDAELRNYTVNLSDIAGRLDGSYHVPMIDAILHQLSEEAREVTIIGDPRISKHAILPGRFARIYVDEGQGTVFFGGKQLFELDPSNKKYLSLSRHGDRIKRELLLKKNTILITRSGTIGKVVLVPEHWEHWVVNEHVIRVIPVSSDIAGYLYVFLNMDYGRELITRFTYGAVVDEIDDHHVSQIPLPLLKDVNIQAEINRLALEASAKRTEAYLAEQEAIRITNEDVIHAVV